MPETHHDNAALKVGEAMDLLPQLEAELGERGGPLIAELRAKLKGAQAHLNNCRFLDTGELAARWRCTPGNLQNNRIAGVGPRFTRPGGKKRGRVLYPIEEIERFESDRTFSSTTESQASE